jgi:hypothetical protein
VRQVIGQNYVKGWEAVGSIFSGRRIVVAVLDALFNETFGSASAVQRAALPGIS